MSASLDHLEQRTLGNLQYVLGAEKGADSGTSRLRMRLEPMDGNTYAWFVGDLGGMAVSLPEAVVAMGRAVGRLAGVEAQKKFLINVGWALR